MRDLSDIGFYTLSDARVRQASHRSPLWRCELLITDACNFKCSYCRGVKEEHCGTLPTEKALSILRFWMSEGLKNVRFSGGEPLVHRGLGEMVAACHEGGVERIAISTNGSFPESIYAHLLSLGVNDFSVSLDACCAADGDRMAGDVPGAWDKVVSNIRYLASHAYVTVGVVLTDENMPKTKEIVEFADSLGVADIRIISAAQTNQHVDTLGVSYSILDTHPILKYRIENIERGRSVRGLCPCDNNRCPLVLDDVAVVGDYHFPCIIYLREQGAPIGRADVDVRNIRQDRRKWAAEHDTHADPICSKNCLDVCVDYDNRFRELRGEKA